MSFIVRKPGLLATVQDLGRYGHQKYGVSASGAMDPAAARTANLLVGNDGNAAVLELTLAGAELAAEEDALIAICGGDMAPHADGSPVPQWRPVPLRQGSVLRFAARKSGCRVYVAAAGGFGVPLELGSASTYIRAGIGGLEGRALRAGDRLPVQPAKPGSLAAQMLAHFRTGAPAPNWHAEHFVVSHAGGAAAVRAIAGPDAGALTAESRAALFGEPFRLSVHSDRMGCWLEGPALELAAPREPLSEAVALGTVQLPPGGRPIVLLADRQTTGGYPKIAYVATVDIPVLAQLAPGDPIQFEEIGLEEAERLLLEAERDMAQLETALRLKFV